MDGDCMGIKYQWGKSGVLAKEGLFVVNQYALWMASVRTDQGLNSSLLTQCCVYAEGNR